MFCSAANWASSSDRQEENQIVGGEEGALCGPVLWVLIGRGISGSDGSAAMPLCGVFFSETLQGSMYLSEGGSSEISRMYRDIWKKSRLSAVLCFNISMTVFSRHKCKYI